MRAAVHGLGPRRRLRRPTSRPGPTSPTASRTASTTSTRRRCCAAARSATARCRWPGRPGSDASGARLGPLRVRRLGDLRHPGRRALPGSRSTCAPARRPSRQAARAARRRLGRRLRRAAPGPARRRHHLRAGRRWSWPPRCKALDRGGVVAINAIHLDHLPEIDYDDLWWERSIRVVANVTRADVGEFLALAAAIPVRDPHRGAPARPGRHRPAPSRRRRRERLVRAPRRLSGQHREFGEGSPEHHRNSHSFEPGRATLSSSGVTHPPGCLAPRSCHEPHTGP